MGGIDFEADANPPERVASDEQLEELADLIDRYRQVCTWLEASERRVKALRETKEEMERHEIPGRMAELGVVQLAAGPEHVVLLEEVAYGRVPMVDLDFGPEGQEPELPESHRWLLENGHGDLLEVEETQRAPRGDLEMLELMRRTARGFAKRGAKVSLKMGVRWNTFEAFLREQVLERKAEVPLALFNGYVGPRARIKEREKR